MTQGSTGACIDRKLEVLVVDDDTHTRVALVAMLQGLDLGVVAVGSGEEALRQLLAQEFAVVLLDVQMPGLDGFELAELIRGRDRCRHLPIIFVTALGGDEHIERAYLLGAIDFLFKPVVADVLRAKVGVFVDLHRRRRRAEEQSSLLREAERREHERRLSEIHASLEGATLRAQMEAERRASERLHIVADMAIELLAVHDTGSMLERVAERLTRELGLDACAIYLVDDSRRRLRRAVAAGGIAREIVEVDGGAVDELLRQGRRWVGDASDPAVTMPLPELGLAGWAILPLPVPDGVLGVLVCGRRTQVRVGAEDLSVLHVVCHQIARAIDRVRLVDELRRRASALAETDRRKDEFLAMLGRELRSPLAPIAYAAELMKGQPVDGVQLERVRSMIESHVQSMTRLVDELLDVARTIAGKMHDGIVPSVEARPRSREPRIASSSRMTVLLIEDNRDSREMLQLLLETLGHRVEVAEDGTCGLERMLGSPPDLAIVDIGLPGMSGYEVARSARDRLGDSCPRMVALTGYGQPEDRARALAAGFDDHLIKPITPESLRRLLA